jgi:leucyl-tRNA---protein transferase
MARLIQHILEKPRACSYLANEVASLEHRIMLDVEPEELDWLLEHGYRRFGPDYFRPACTQCGQCISTRILVPEFAPTRSQRRARNRLAQLRVMVGPPQIDLERLNLYHAWHAEREAAREWSPSVITFEDYFHQFAFPHPSGRELAYYDDAADGKLVAIGICDETPKSWSAVYCFYDPAYARYSLGTANVLMQIEIARTQDKPYVYLGYRVDGCMSLKYKAAFHPQEELLDRPLDFEPPVWKRIESETPDDSP